MDLNKHNYNLAAYKRNPYFRQAMYYETDQMGIVHHSNYIRWFEEARLDYLKQIDLDYDKIEDAGIYIPVLGVTCKYKSSVRFNDKVLIYTNIEAFNGVKMTITYYIFDSDSHILKATGESEHCFVNKEFKPVNMKKNYLDIYDKLIHWVEKDC